MLDDDIHLLQVDAQGEGLRSYGLYHRWDGRSAYAVNLVAVIEPNPIRRTRFEALMTRVAAAFPLIGKPAGLTAIADMPGRV
jgi:hypothetical protein